ncbi:hypothetical protein RAHE111665_09780 [Rariglobus hedericola]
MACLAEHNQVALYGVVSVPIDVVRIQVTNAILAAIRIRACGTCFIDELRP